jgi:exodeoxyribonuclease-3
MYRVITFNANGIRSAAKKGFFDWLLQQNADVVCIQETKATYKELAEEFYPQGYHVYFLDAQKKGYSGVAVFCREKPQEIVYGLNFPLCDEEGRYVQVDFANHSVVSLYMPSGTSGEIRQNLKYVFLDKYIDHLQQIRTLDREFIICGDFNIAHKNIDIKNWRGNKKNSGFLPEERAWLDKIFDEVGFVDAFRVVNELPDQYTWWSNRGQARAKNVGWRIDYQIVTPGLAKVIKEASIYTEQKFSDHAPLVMDYAI